MVTENGIGDTKCDVVVVVCAVDEFSVGFVIARTLIFAREVDSDAASDWMEDPMGLAKTARDGSDE